MSKPIEVFFKHLLGPRAKGWICVATLDMQKENSFKERFFEWPTALPAMLEYIETMQPYNVYFCPHLLSKPRRIKDNVITVTAAWADLDECEPDKLLVKPSIIVESSPLHYQAYWLLEDALPPEDAQGISKRIAYYHSFQGADRSGWDLTQLLRVPGTFNRKERAGEALVRTLEMNRNRYRFEDFKKYPKVVDEIDPDQFPYPGADLEGTGQEILEKYVDVLPPQVQVYFENEPDPQAKEGWSGALWHLQMGCFEAGLSLEETFLVCRDSSCNRFKRDNKPMVYLWNDICRGFTRHQENRKLLAPKTNALPPLLSREEAQRVEGVKTFVEEYIQWAKGLGDAAEQYHQAGALTILSTLLAGCVRLPTSFGIVKPNLWFMILADTTLTRKSTAMDIAMDLIEEVDQDSILATDGSIEGLMQGLAGRPGKPSIFLRDEFSGLLESITKKDYYAGMAETLTKLYDGKFQKRVLKKEVTTVKDPCLIIFAGGIKNKVCGLLTTEHVSSGFIPRFVFLTAESDASKVKPLGPPSAVDTSGRDKILELMRELKGHYTPQQGIQMTVNAQGQLEMAAPDTWDAKLTPETWQRYNVLEADMMRAGLKSAQPDMMTPTYDRLSKSALKTAVLIAASRKRPMKGKEVVVELNDLLLAIKYAQQWREHTNQVVNNIGLGSNEREMEKIRIAIAREPGVARSTLMQRYHLTSRSADGIFATLEQRGQIERTRQGKTERLFPFIVNPIKEHVK